MTEEASPDDYSGSGGNGPTGDASQAIPIRGHIVETWEGDIRLAQCTTLLVLWDAILTLIGPGVATYADAAPTRRLHVGKNAGKRGNQTPPPAL